MIVPEAAFQDTVLSVTVPCTEAANCCVPAVFTDAEAGESVTEVTVGVDGAAITVSVAEADFVASAALVAVTVSLPVVDGAV